MKEQYLLCADTEYNGSRWEKVISKDLCLEKNTIKEMAEDFYVKGTGYPAATILSDFNELDTLLYALLTDTFFLIPVSPEEIIVRITETDARKTVADLNANKDETDDEKVFTLYKYTTGCLSRITT